MYLLVPGGRAVPGPVPLVVRMPPHDDEVAIVAEDESFPTVEEIIPRSEKVRSDFSKVPTDDPEISELLMKEVGLAEFREKFKI